MNKKTERAKRAIAQTCTSRLITPAVARFAGSFFELSASLGFRSAPPQALCFRRASRAKSNSFTNQIRNSFMWLLAITTN
jgi:hypothetical protein